MLDGPLVSICIPVFNGEKYIRKALDSLIGQDYLNIEIIISDNASTDKTNGICNEYAAKDKRIKIYRQRYNVGVTKNFEKVVGFAQGKYFMWAGVDDYWFPEFVSVLVNELEHCPEAGVAMSAVHYKYEDNNPPNTIRFQGADNPNKMNVMRLVYKLTTPLKFNLFICGIFRTDLLRDIIPVFSKIPSADRWFLIKISLSSTFRYVDQVLYVRTIRKKLFYERYPEDEYGRKKQQVDQKWFDFTPIPVVFTIILKSVMIPKYKKLFAPVVVGCIFYQRLILGIRRMLKSIILRFCPHILYRIK
jgi:glycosyltransferase involved in cell wall biosynthesis